MLASGFYFENIFCFKNIIKLQTIELFLILIGTNDHLRQRRKSFSIILTSVFQYILSFVIRLYNIQMSKKIDAHILRQFKIGHLMGSGAYGYVWRVQQKHTGKQFALKKIFGAFSNNVDAQRTYRQVEILQQLKHRNIIKLIKVLGSTNKKDLYLVFELMEADLLAVVGTKVLSISHKRHIVFQILKAIQYLHQLKLIHRDLKPSNVLLNSECIIKICDFGLVRSLNTEENQNPILSEEVATQWYQAPQLLLGSRSYGYQVDLWSIGCIIAELLTGKTLFAGSSTLDQLERILQFIGPISKEDLESLDSPAAEFLIVQLKPKVKQFTDYFLLSESIFYPLLRGLLCLNPRKRMTICQALNLQIFKQIKDQFDDNCVHPIKPIALFLNDNLRFSSKQYRKEIYSSIPSNLTIQHKQNVVKISSPKNQGNPKGLNNLHAPLKKTSKSLITDHQRQISKINHRSISKKPSASSHSMIKINPSNLKITKKKSSQSQSYLSDKKYSPYKTAIKASTVYLDNCNNVQNIQKFENKSHNIKKVRKNPQKKLPFCRK